MDAEITMFDWIAALGLGLLIALGAGVAIKLVLEARAPKAP